jgi:hypothetical protein
VSSGEEVLLFKSFVRALSSDFETHTTAASAEAAAEVCAIVSEASGSEVSVSRDSSCNTSADFPRSPSSRNPMARKRESLQVAKSIYTCYFFLVRTHVSLLKGSARATAFFAAATCAVSASSDRSYKSNVKSSYSLLLERILLLRRSICGF